MALKSWQVQQPVLLLLEKEGKTTSTTHTYNRGELASHLRSMKAELEKLSAVLKKDAA